MSLVSFATNYVLKAAKPAIKEFKIKPYVSDVVKFTSSKAKDTAKAVTSPVKHVRSEFDETLNMYNIEKLRTSEKFNTGTRELNNWMNSYGFKDNKGQYSVAINHLNETGAIDKYIAKRFPNIKDSRQIARLRGVLNNYLEHNLDIYTYPRITDILTKFNKEISQKLKDGAIVYVPSKTKSYGLITEMYRQINPDAKIVTGWNNLKKYMASNKDLKIVTLDDCLGSGKSALDLQQTIANAAKQTNSKVKSLDLYVLSAYENGLKKLADKNINVHYDSVKTFLNKSDYFKNEVKGSNKQLLLGALGSPDPKFNAYGAIMFPYMAPNNNSLFSAQMMKELFTGPECAIKNVFAALEANEKISSSILRNLENTTSQIA
ncbi:MAG: hypothetical protein SPL73_07665 [Cyanobacteriota bacterium]|nr:hypothetical protein [Cyanobacteriota bacterium]MDY6364747.1 hypothetical protein [Cyanobacteriota bacterium]MDY6383117.1 hypothetical protein [Cyanobacteriota bacterium]